MSMGDGTPLYAPKCPPGVELKGGGLRGGPKRWTGKGPRPARHIPWPELFKHHLSVIEGHQRMIDMVRKHTVPETGNWRTIIEMLDRCHEMLQMTKKASRDFIPPPQMRESVPIGSSSASMYPGYSPADHIYGEAAEEYGRTVTEAKKAGIQVERNSGGPEYELAQQKRSRERALNAERAAADEAAEIAKVNATGVNSTAMNGNKSKVDVKDPSGSTDGLNPYFVIDSFPTNGKKPPVSENSEAVSKPSKKAKTKHDGPLPSEPETRVEFEDISEAVDARMKAKEEKRKAKESKRKRESVDEPSAEAATVTNAEKAEDVSVENPKKKKSKNSKDTSKADEAVGEVKTKKRRIENADEAERKKKKKKNQKKSKN